MTESEAVVETEKNGAKGENDPEKDNSKLEGEIIRQVEYYFGDLNLPRDKFLSEQVKLDDGWVPLDVLTTFKRLASLSKDTAVIAAALNNSDSGLLEVSDDSKKVRRNPELPIPEMNEERRKELTSRSLYVKGFPKDSNLDFILKWFKDYPEVENVIMRRYQDRASKQRHFKGSVFATFKTKDQALKFLETKDLKIENTDLLVRWQDEYLEEKQQEYADRKERKNKPKNKREENEEGGDKQKKEEEFKLPLGAILHFTNSYEKLSREHIKEALTTIGGEVAYIDFKLGDKEGWVRLSKENAAKEIIDKITDGKLNIQDNEVTFKVLADEDEKTFLAKTAQEMAQRRKNINKNKHHKGNKGYHHNKGNRHQGSRKRKQGPHSDAPSEKAKADD